MRWKSLKLRRSRQLISNHKSIIGGTIKRIYIAVHLNRKLESFVELIEGHNIVADKQCLLLLKGKNHGIEILSKVP